MPTASDYIRYLERAVNMLELRVSATEHLVKVLAKGTIGEEQLVALLAADDVLST